MSFFEIVTKIRLLETQFVLIHLLTAYGNFVPLVNVAWLKTGHYNLVMKMKDYGNVEMVWYFKNQFTTNNTSSI